MEELCWPYNTQTIPCAVILLGKRRNMLKGAKRHGSLFSAQSELKAQAGVKGQRAAH